MRLYTYGSQRKKGGKANSLIVSEDTVLPSTQDKTTTAVRTVIVGKRRYILRTTPDEVLAMLLALAPEEIANAVGKLENVETIPEIIKQLSAGAITASTPQPSSLFDY